MSLIQLKYGRGAVPFEYDPDRFQVLAQETDETPLTDAEIGAALDQPIDSPPLGEVVEAGDSVLLIVSDATRATGSAQVVNLLVRRLIESGVMPGDIKIMFATGIHRPVTLAEQRELLTAFIVQRIGVIHHDANDAAAMIDLGDEIDGVPVRVNRALREFDKVIVIGGVGYHYFAGFSGGRKSICPGVASADIIRATHRLAMDFETGGRRAGVGAGLLDGNAVHSAIDRIAALIEPALSINTVVGEDGKMTGLYAGHWRTAHGRACDEYLASHSVQIPQKRELVVVSCGGWPYDINLIQAHKALEMASHACTEGGTIIWLAECSEGLGRADFLQWFDAADSRTLAARLRTQYQVNGQTAWTLLQKAERFDIRLVSRVTGGDIQRMRLSGEESIADALGGSATTNSGYILPLGAKLLPRA
jgi:nickel-dependent lactate racemase